MVTTTTLWTPTTHADYDELKGRDVVSADGEQLGTIDAVFHPPQAAPEARAGHYVLVRPDPRANRFGGGEELYVPESAIATVAEEGVTLGHAAAALPIQGWDQEPIGLDRFERA